MPRTRAHPGAMHPIPKRGPERAAAKQLVKRGYVVTKHAWPDILAINDRKRELRFIQVRGAMNRRDKLQQTDLLIKILTGHYKIVCERFSEVKGFIPVSKVKRNTT